MSPIQLTLVMISFLTICSQVSAKNFGLQNIAAVPVGVASSGTISLPGQEDRFTFSGSVGQRFYYDALDLDSEAINARLISPRGETVFDQNHSLDYGPFYLLETGTYTLIVDGLDDTTGDYNFRFLDVANAINLGYDTTTAGSLNPPSQTKLYQFAGIMGQRVRLDSISASGSSANWRLFAPFNQQLLTQNITASSVETTLPVTGIYTVLVEGDAEGPTALNYEIKVALISNPTGTPNGLGVVQSGLIAMNQTNSFSLTSIPAGTVVYFDSLTNSDVGWTELLDPSGERVFITYARSDGVPYRLAHSGDYTLNIIGYENGSYRFRLLDCSSTGADVTDLMISNPVSFTFDLPFASHVYRLTNVNVGQCLFYDALGADFDPVGIRLFGPRLSYHAWEPANANHDLGLFTITEPGPYYLVVESLAESTPNDFTFRLLDVARSPATNLVLDTVYNGSLSPLHSDVYTFVGNAGQRLYIDMAATNEWTAHYYVYGPNNLPFASNYLHVGSEIILPQTGTNLLVLYSPYTTNVAYSFSVSVPTVTTNALIMGATMTGTLSGGGDTHRLVFSGSAEQRLFFDALDDDFDSINVWLEDSLGRRVDFNGNSDFDFGIFTLPRSDTYTLVFKQMTSMGGDYKFRLIDVTQAPVRDLVFNTTISDLLLPGTRQDIYRFTGTAGQKLFFDSSGTNAAGSWILFDLQNLAVFGGGINGDGEVSIQQAGTYYLAVGYHTDANPLGYSFRVATSTVTTNALTIETTYSGTLAHAGDEHAFTFNGTPGMRLYYDSLNLDAGSIGVSLRSPSGSINHINGNSHSDAGPFTLNESGTYTLVQRTTTDQAGLNYQFRLLNAGTADSVSYGSTVNGQINPQSSAKLYRFNGTAGELLNLQSLSASSSNAFWYLYSPANVQLDSALIGSDMGQVMLRFTGTHTIVVSGTAPNLATLDFQFRVSLVSSGSGSPTGFGVTNSGISLSNVTNTYIYTAPAGLPVYLDSYTNSFTVNYQLLAPSGQQVFSTFGYYDGGPYVLPESGNYTLHVIGQTEGNFKFRLLNMNEATNLVFGAKYEANIEDYHADIYQFTGTNGQRLLFDSLQSNPLSTVMATLYHPSGTYSLEIGSYSDSYSFTLNESGTFYLVLNGYQINSTNYSFRLLDVMQTPSQVVPLDTVMGGNLEPKETLLYRFTGTKGQRLFFDSLNPTTEGQWTLYDPDNSVVNWNVLNGDFPATLSLDGTYLLTVASAMSDPAPYSFRIVTPDTTTTPINFATDYAGNISEPGEEDYFTFHGTAGQRIYFDALDSDTASARVILIEPGPMLPELWYPTWYTSEDYEPITLQQTGTYTVRIKGVGDLTSNYRFRLLDLASAPLISLDTLVTNNITLPFGAVLYRLPATPHLRLFVDHTIPINMQSLQYLYDESFYLNSGWIGSDFEFTPAATKLHVLVLSSWSSNALPYSFKVIPGNHAPVLAPMGNRTVDELTSLNFIATASDLEAPNDQLTYSLDAGNPPGSSIDPVTGAFTWIPSESQGPGTYPITIRVTDDGLPSFSDFETIFVTVNEVNPEPITLTPVSFNAGQFQMSVSGAVGPTYIIQTSSNLVNWISLTTNTPAVTPFNYTDSSSNTNSHRYYRVMLAP